MADEQVFDQSEIDALMGAASAAEPPAAAGAPEQSDAASSSPTEAAEAAPSEPSGASAGQPDDGAPNPDRDGLPEQDVEYLLEQAEQALHSIGGGVQGDLPPGAKAYRLEEFPGAPASTEKATIDLIRDVELDLKIELGRTHMHLEDVLKLRKGSVVTLDKLAGDPVDVYVNGRLIARGEVLVLNDNFCVRVAELIAGSNVAS
jgi:flagellar motor switch protein FliN/FliY